MATQSVADSNPQFPSEYAVEDPGPGMLVVNLHSYSEFDAYIREQMLDFRHFVWRGQASSKWKLESTFDRLLRKHGQVPDERLSAVHLTRFKFAARGRRGPNPAHLDDNDWWALGQHNGLATPLLDWSRSPYVAAYFAYYTPDSVDSERRAIFGLSPAWTVERSDAILAKWKDERRAPIVEFVTPLTDDNPRLINQSALFTRAPDGIDLESWVAANITPTDPYLRLVKITVPDTDRSLALRLLNRMNINHLTLFPDLYGAAKFVNLDLMIDKY